MPKSIPIALANHKAGNTLTTSFLLKIGPTPSESYFGLTSLDKNEVYDDGTGELTYYANSGIQLSTLEATNDLSVDNGEAQSLITLIPTTGITQDMVDKGEIDTVEFVIYDHDYLNGAAGEHEVFAAGVLGRCRVVQGILVIPELRSWTQLLDQNGLISRTSLQCRSKQFGSQPGDEREYCGYDLTAEWVDFVVIDVGTDSVREFTIAASSSTPIEAVDDYYWPGVVKWDTGDNVGYQREVEAYAATGDLSLRFILPHAAQIGDEGQIRRDCTRNWSGHNSCDTFFTTTKGAHFRGEPNIPIGDTMANTTPGVNSPTAIGSGE